ncbi:hypothetical protein LLG90_24085 [Aromatoleum toluclasticum]|uniref:hypothetical protein n=1 Tax=Aromatoleum toluclasticum TaxID=92003 RepID=UPI001D186BBD|nr:hypothetical protein [Aromatoleum toluclasticum]MCC4118441.1 hypothetical protein [Aromatoleum toluclasticum]
MEDEIHGAAQVLRLLKEDLRLFHEDMRLTRASVLHRRHHSRLATLMPQMRLATRVLNATDTAANVTIGVGAASVAGIGAAAYLFGAAAVMPIIAPAAPFVGGALLVAGVFKWITDKDRRRDGEIRHKREAFEKAFRAQLEEAQASFDQQLRVVAQEFSETARQIVEPILLGADAAERLAGLQVKMATRVIEQSRLSLKQLVAQIPR